MNRFVFVAVILFAQGAFAAALPVTIGTSKGPVPLKLEIAATPAAREQGLMNRKTLKPMDGMLFLFPTSGRISFWMKNTLIPLDIIFISEYGHVVHVATNTTPLSLAPIESGGEYLAVIEIAGGRAAKLGIKDGDHVTYTLPQQAHVE